jgi:hypothetical protein
MLIENLRRAKIKKNGTEKERSPKSKVFLVKLFLSYLKCNARDTRHPFLKYSFLNLTLKLLRFKFSID